MTSPYPLAQKHENQASSVIMAGSHPIGDGCFTVMAGPCAVESEEQIHTIAASVAKSGATLLRGGAFKPRTSPYTFQGLGEQGLRLLKEASDANGMGCISEVMAPSKVDLVAQYVDILQVGARNMQNYPLLEALGKSDKPVMLKRGLAATYHEWLLAAEHIMCHGNMQVILCERGIRTFETAMRNTLDLNAVPYLKQHTHLPIIVDPSHGTGLRELVPPMSKAAMAVGANGLIIEVHHQPEASLSDARQAIATDTFASLMQSLKALETIL